jgi:hypothetical protein
LTRLEVERRGGAIFVQEFSQVERPYHEVAARLTGGWPAILDTALRSTRTESARFWIGVARSGWPPSLSESMEIRPGPIRTQRFGILLAFSWQADGDLPLFPQLDADLDVAPFGNRRTTLTLQARYQIGPDMSDRQDEDILLYRLAESITRAFLSSVCASLERAVR